MAIGRIPEPGTGIPESIIAAKGDVLTGTANDVPAVITVGANETRLVADSAAATGLKYVADTTNYAVAAKGDLLVGTAADTLAPLTVGTNGHTLVADSAQATGLKWAAASSGLTLINTTTFSGVAAQNIDSIFTSTYTNYKLIITVSADANNRDLRFRLRRNGSDISTDYRSALRQLGSGGTLQSITGSTGYIDMGKMRGDASSINAYDVTVYHPANSTGRKPMSYTGWNAYGDPGSDGIYWGGGDCIVDTNSKDGFALYTGAGTISGTVRVYGLAN